MADPECLHLMAALEGLVVHHLDLMDQCLLGEAHHPITGVDQGVLHSKVARPWTLPSVLGQNTMHRMERSITTMLKLRRVCGRNHKS